MEIYKTLNKLDPGYMNDIFELRNTNRLNREKYKLNLEIPKPKLNLGLRFENVECLTLPCKNVSKL